MPRRSRSSFELVAAPEVPKALAGDHRPWRKATKVPLDCDREIIEMVMEFLGTQVYLSVASVSALWRKAWGQQPTVTSRRWAVQSRSCLDWARACGLDIWDSPCLFAAAEGRLDVLQHAVALGYSREGMPICEWAAGGGHLEVVKWCRANDYPWGWSSIGAAEGGHQEVLEWCVANGCPINMEGRPFGVVAPRGHHRGKQIHFERGVYDVFTAAAWSGHLEILMWLRDQGYRWSRETCHMAAKGRHLDVLMWLKANGCPWSLGTMNGVASAGDVDILKWCKANGSPWDDFVVIAAAEGGNLEVVKWCVGNDQHRRSHIEALTRAAAKGHLEVVRWMRANGCPWRNGVCCMAACGGHMEVLKWCLANGCPWGRFNLSKIYAFNGSVTTMTWAASNACPWISTSSDFNEMCTHAAYAGNLEVLKWCAAYRPFSIPMVSRGAASRGQVHVLEWLRATGRLSDGDVDTALCTAAALSGSLETVKWCRANNFPWGSPTIMAAIGSRNLELLHWCRANGCPWGIGIPEIVFCQSNIEMLAWCRSNGCPLALIPRRFQNVKDEMFEWCRNHLPRSSVNRGRRSRRR